MKSSLLKSLFAGAVALAGLGVSADMSTAESDLLHRWSFNGSVADSVGGKTATLGGTAKYNTASNAVSLTGTANNTSYIALGTGLVPTTSSPITIEIWATQNATKNWARIFDFGSDNKNYLLMSWTQSSTLTTDRVEIDKGGTVYLKGDNTMQPYTLNTEYHISLTLTPQSDGKTKLAWAKRDVATGAVLKSGSGTTSAAWDPSAIAAYANCWLGRSQYTADCDAYATYNEVRIWKTAMTADQLLWSAQLGPDVLPTAAVIPDLTRTLTLTDCTNGTVSVNGAAAVGASTQTVSVACNTSLQAIPEEGYVFCRWTGDTQYITSGSATTTNITVSTAHNITLAAVFDAEKPVYARYMNNQLTYLTAKKGVTEAPADGMTNTITVVFSSDAEYQALAATYTNEVAKSKGLELEANIKLTADADWTTLDYSLAGYSVDLNGKHLVIGSLLGSGGYTSEGNMVANGTFEANSIASGAYTAMTPNGWRSGGSVYLIKNNSTYAGKECNSSNWCLLWNGGYLQREITITQPANYHIQLTAAARNSGAWYWSSRVYAGFDGGTSINETINTGYSGNRSATVWLAAGTHTFKVGCNSGSCIILDNVYVWKDNSATQTGVLEVNVPEGKTLTDGSVAFGGGQALQLWKSGKGTLQMTKQNNGFGSSNGYVSMIVKDGIVQKKEPSAGTPTCGPQYCTIQVDDGGTLDVNGRSYWDYNYILNGAGYNELGALRNTGAVSDAWTKSTYGYVRNINLGSDTTIKGSQYFGMSFWNHSANTMTMNNHTVHYGGTIIYFGNMSYSGKGTVVIDKGCTMESYISSPTLAGCTLQVDGQLQQHDVALGTISNLIFTATGTFNNPWTTRPAYTVLDTYAPNLNAGASSVAHPTLTLGATSSLYTTLDLSRFTDTFDGTTTTFFANTLVTVELGDRELVDQQKLVSWTTVPSVTSWTASGTNVGNLSVKAKSDGLYLVAAPSWAEWDLTNECWKFFRADGTAYTDTWEDGVTSEIDVHFASLAEFEAIKAQNVSPARYLLTKLELTPGSTLYDFTTGFNFAIAPNMVIDLHGNRLKLPSANIGGAVPFTITDTSEFVANGSFESFTGTLGNSGNWNYLSSTITLNNWTGPTNAGITKNSGTWINSAVPAGTYACFMQCNSYIQQTITAPGDGNYRLSFSYAERPKYTGATLYVMIDDKEVKTITGITATTFSACSVDLALTAGTHTLKFGTRLVNSSDQGTAIDNVKLCKLGELIIDVADGVSIANSQVAITGNARVTKTGAGTFTASRASQSYASGTEIAAGQCTIGNTSCFGASGTEVQVNTNATLEINGVGGLNAYTFVLAGGTMQNTKSDVGEGNHQLLKMRLTADSTFKPTCSYGFIGPSYAATSLDLAGHTLTVPIGTSGKYFWLFNTTVTAGTIDITSGGWLKVDKTAVNAGSTTFRVNCALNIAAPFTVGGYEARYGGTAYNAGTTLMTVNKTFKPANACYRGSIIKDGVTLDLSQFSGVLTGTSAFTATPNTLVYPTNATLQVELHGRALTSPKIIGWTTAPNNVTFVPTEQTHRDGRMLVTKDDGVYVVGGTVIFFR